jgi:hypothetical protein
VKQMRALYARAEQMGHEPEIVADVILEAVTATRPKVRYAVPFTAKAIIAAVHLVPDRLMDAARHIAMRRLR